MTNLIEIKSATAPPPAHSTSNEDRKHVRWAAERFYWAVLDGSSLPRNLSRRRRHEQLGYLFENVLPGVAIEEVQTAYAPIDGDEHKVIACGMRVAELHAALNADSAALTLAPAEMPTFVQYQVNADVDPGILNMLTGDLEPEAVRRSKRRAFVWGAAMLALLSGLLTLGLQRRVSHAWEQLVSIQQQERETLQRTLGSSPSSSAQPPHLRLMAELRQLQQTRQPSGGKHDRSFNLVGDFEKLMNGWPVSVFMQTESVVITDQSIAVRGRVPTMADVQVLTDALALDGWKLQQPQSTQVNDRAASGGGDGGAGATAVELSLRMERAADPALAKGNGS